LFVGRIITN